MAKLSAEKDGNSTKARILDVVPTDASPSKHESFSIPVISADCNITMQNIDDFPVSSVSAQFANEITKMNRPDNTITPLKSLPDINLCKLQPQGKIIVPLSFPEHAVEKTYRFEMLVVPRLKHAIVFGRNHLIKTAAAINSTKQSIHFRNPSMNFQIPIYDGIERSECLQSYISST